MQLIFVMLIAYLAGSIPIGKIIGRFHGVDIQARGSGNIGFANVQRILGWRAGLITLLADVLKGFLPTLLAYNITSPRLAFWVGVVAVIGHIYPVWLRFKGGKGVATGLGVMLCVQPIAGLVGLVVYCIWRLLGTRSSTGSLSGIIALAIVTIIISPADWWQPVVFGVIACWTLRHNIRGTVPNHDLTPIHK